MKLPTIKELSAVLRDIKPEISDEYTNRDDPVPHIDITVGWHPRGTWGVQTGDNSFTGVAYSFPHWAVGTLYRRSNTRAMARDLIDQLYDLGSQ